MSFFPDNKLDPAFHITLPESIEGEVLKALLDVLAKRGLRVHVYVSRNNQEQEVDGIGLRCVREEEA
ncbi:hypothetical protein CMI37_36330 [Candidatus Pacearchaeota archaeon]|jgi:cytosine/adenosine deaminase-related metal-dependent hydrolase|nr:hypothetical protein [Candidatus Pacearchaeota archaeon]|tara:strand:- start:587 stop:787 length:201 start_codon:yes stop_codon:yes gene_type:complete